MKAALLALACVVVWQVVVGDAFLIGTSLRYVSSTKALSAKPVQQVDLESGKTIAVYDSISDAARSVGVDRNSISRVVRGTSISCGAGFSWRPKQRDKTLPRPRGKNGIPIPCEQIDMRTLEVVDVYPSAMVAAKAIGGSNKSILRVVHGAKQRASYKGFYWRRAGDSSKPRRATPDNQRVVTLGKQRVQQICPESGHVIGTFESAAAAGSALGIKSYTISRVLQGIQHKTGGFRFRTVGTPQKFIRDNRPRQVHQISLDTGQIIATFASYRKAGKAVGVAGSSISSAARGKTDTSAGYRWELA